MHTWQLAVRIHPAGAQGGCGVGQRDCSHRRVADAGQLLRRLGTAALQAAPPSCGVPHAGDHRYCCTREHRAQLTHPAGLGTEMTQAAPLAALAGSM